MQNNQLYAKYAWTPKINKTMHVKFYILFTIFFKRICTSLSMFYCVALKICKFINLRALVMNIINSVYQKHIDS